ncbi:polyprenyl synthetase [Bacteriovorax sp. BSW11_IV]|uniref:polyprenyl synthetase family protein n=1 Tax=Bacteriovorax sp. BSW11_IV TaxID=1353529 RepID=UPI000389FD00|nr:polyprenyl synthetase family protein [Bacteriovorax sp. BSW11_IV]EQC49431.1 polyprenyl synthetase [Bacteriovorax sp. BSW11_IV]
MLQLFKIISFINDSIDFMLHEFLSSIPEEILETVGELDLNIESKDCNTAINDLLTRTVLVGGKRLRPLLTYIFGNLFFVEPSKLIPFARAIELVHAASLAHDDVVDNASTRRGEPSINALSSNQKAVLAGDYLLADVIHSLSYKGDLKIVREMSLVIQALADGEWIQLDASKERNYSHDLITKVAMKKTASVMGWCCWIGSYVAGKNESIQNYAKEFGEKIGVAFQLMDDTLDFSKDSKKDALLDVQNGIINSVLYEWLLLHPEIKARFENGENVADLFDGDRIDEACAIVEKRALDLLTSARELLVIIEKECALNSEELERFEKAKIPVFKILEYLAGRKF